jgi:hypothetical protein
MFTLGNTEFSARTRAAAGNRNKIQTARLLQYLLRQAREQRRALSACLRDQIRYDRAGNPGAAGKIAAKRRIIFAPESS